MRSVSIFDDVIDNCGRVWICSGEISVNSQFVAVVDTDN